MLLVNVTWAAAAVLMSEKRAGKRVCGSRCPVRRFGAASDAWTERNQVMQEVNTFATGGRLAYDMGGIGPQDLQLVELHDCFATAEILHYENLGYVGTGGGRFDQIQRRYI